MHIPALLAGFISGPVSGLLVGLLAPALSFLLTGMPPAYAVLLMTLELVLYGLAAGLTFRNMKIPIYPALLISMLAGRIGFALGILMFGLFLNLPYGVMTYLKITFITGLPGILLHLVVIPPIVMAVRRRFS